MFHPKHHHTCPYCLSQFKQSEALLRCSAVTQVCAHEIDEVYTSFFNPKTEIPKGRLVQQKVLSTPKKFLKKESALRSACDQCATPTDTYVCPFCHGDLPEHFFLLRHLPFGVYAHEPEIFNFFLNSFLKKMRLITGHDIGATLRFYPDLKGCVLTFDSEKVLLSLHDVRRGRRDQKGRLVGGIIFEHIGALFKEKEKRLTYDNVNFLKSLLSEGAPLGAAFYALESYFGYFPKASSLLECMPYAAAQEQKTGERISQELLTLFGASYGVNLMRQIKEVEAPWRFGACSFVEHQSVPLSSFHRVEDLLLWQLFLQI